MANLISTGSPKLSRRATPTANANTTGSRDAELAGDLFKNVRQSHASISQLGKNVNPVLCNEDTPQESATGLSDILARLRINDTRKVNSADAKQLAGNEARKLDFILNSLNDQHKTLRQQELEIKECSGFEIGSAVDLSACEDSPQNAGCAIAHDKDTQQSDNDDIARIRKELEAARNIISRQEVELSESRNFKHTMEQAMSPPSEADYPLQPETRPATISHPPSLFNATARPFTSRNDTSWLTADDPRGELPTAFINTGAGRGRVQLSQLQIPYVDGINVGLPTPTYANQRDSRQSAFGYGSLYNNQTSPVDAPMTGGRPFSASSNASYGIEERMYNGTQPIGHFSGVRRNNSQLRSNSTFSDPLSPNLSANLMLPTTGVTGQYGYTDRPYGAPITPLSPEFPSIANQAMIPTSSINGQTYVTPLEPLNYRRLLDKSVSCDWKYIVDKIVCNNDQQASIFLQQKLKVGTAEQKFEIVDSIVNQAYPLMINRFGNFLVQRCFEHGTPEQINSIANAIHGNVISLSMDPFGCHVVQKAFDSVPEDHKANMVRELLRRIPETVIHRYACHVWQKLFELRWSGEPPQIMLKVNDALHGMWHEVALGETGSLVVQNIFENCIEEEKRPAIEEVVANIDLIAHGQFGNWCIQHLCEHGSPPDKRRVIDHILTNSYSYSIDQFASKVVEKCLKIGGSDFLERYLSVITTARPDRPRIPLIDIAGDQYGNYLIQWILMNTHQHQREQVAIHIRKHMVSLRGSKFGSRVAMLCSNPAVATRTGLPANVVHSYPVNPQQPRSAWPRR